MRGYVRFLLLNIIQLVQHSPYFNLAQPVRWHKKWVMGPRRAGRKKCEKKYFRARVTQIGSKIQTQNVLQSTLQKSKERKKRT